MKELSEVECELEVVELYLRIAWAKDDRRQIWHGYRDALLWVLGREVSQHPASSIPDDSAPVIANGG